MNDELLRTDNSFPELMEKYADTVLHLCLLYLKNKADAEDCFQNVFLRLCEAQPPFHDEEHAKAWLITVTKNECRNQLRCFWRRKVVCVDEFLTPVMEPEDRGVIAALFELPLKYRDILYLFYYEEYKIKELSVMLRLGEATVKTRLKRGRELLKERLTKGGFSFE